MDDDRYLRETAHEVIRAGKLPDRAPDRVWGGPGTGAKCSVCGASTTHAEVELELEFTYDDRPGRDSYLVHQRCYSMLKLEHQNVAPGAVSARTLTPSTGAAAPSRDPGARMEAGPASGVLPEPH
jgi:hypothetical protein